MSPRSQDAPALRRRLLRWYDRHRRDLPWRRTRDPYRIWVSEIMLQQTRVQAVIPYYRKFLRRFPNVQSLAKAKEEELLACWSGLGYYSRAGNLRRAAQVIVNEQGGRFPRDLRAAQALPGIGRYTASAILSIAYGMPLPVLDGNVARVLSRLYALPVDARTARGRASLWQLAESLLYKLHPGEFNQALMELGATVCLPRQPRCPACPLRNDCMAYARKEVGKFPPSRRKVAPRLRRFVAALIQDRAGRVLLVRRPRQARWMAGLWELPMWDQDSAGPPNLPHHFPDNSKASMAEIALEAKLGTVRHTITDNRLDVAVFAASLRREQQPPEGKWIARRQFGRLAVTTITRKAIALLERPN